MNARRQRFAVIDVGTNSVKLIVASVHNGRVVPHHFAREATRLGRGLDRSGRISSVAARKTASAVKRLVEEARAHGADDVVAVGTYALRVARNGREVARAMSRHAGVRVGILTGTREAGYVLASVRGRFRRLRRHVMVVDVGGGSAQLIVARGSRTLLARSVPLGAVVLTERHIHSDPIRQSEYDSLCDRVEATVSGLFAKLPRFSPASVDMIVSGGAATTAAAMTGATLRSGVCTVSLARLEKLNDRTLAATVNQRKRMRGMQPDRADIMPAGLAVLLSFAQHAGVKSVKVAEGGWRAGLILARAQETCRSPRQSHSRGRRKAAARKGR